MTAVRRTAHNAPLCVCWNYFQPHLARAVCALANVPRDKASFRWENLTAAERRAVADVIHVMAERAEEKGQC